MFDKSIVFILFTLILCLCESKPNTCCPNDEIIIENKCASGKRVWAGENCPNKAYILESDKFEIVEDDALKLSSVILIPRDKYCLGKIDKRNGTEAIICFPEQTQSKSKPSKLIMTLCSIISVSSITLTLAVYLILPSLQDLQGKCIMETLFILLIFYITVIILHTITFEYTYCFYIESLLYYLGMTMFFWINVIAINIWLQTKKPEILLNKSKLFFYYNIYSYGCPALMLLIVSIIALNWHDKQLTCWFTIFFYRMIYFDIPIILLFLVNIFMFVSSAITLRKQETNSTNITLKSQKYKWLLYLKLFLIMGICWIFEPLSSIFEIEYIVYVWYITDIINLLQGFTIFLVLVVFRKRVHKELVRRGFCRYILQNWTTIDEECEELTEESERSQSAQNEEEN